MRSSMNIIRDKIQNYTPIKVLKFIQDNVIIKPIIKHRNLQTGKTPLFKAILIELRSKCNGKCSFCPVSIGNDIREDITMDFDLYKKIIQQLKNIKYSGRVAFFNNNEPLITKNLFNYLSYATSNLTNGNTFHICTNGVALSKNIGDILIKSGVNLITVNSYTNDLNEPLPEKILTFEESVIKHNKENKNNIKLKISKRFVNEVLANRSGDAPNKPQPELQEIRGFCLNVFTQLVIDPNGIVGLCCHDAFLSKKFGSLHEQSLIDIWNCSDFQYYRDELLKGNRSKLDVCSNCDYYGCGSPSNSLFKKIAYKLTT